MSEPKRLRIDVSNEAHAQLETEARRQSISVRDLIDQIVRDMTERRGQADAVVRHQRGAQPTVSDEPEPGSPKDSARRIDALIKRVTDDVPKAIETMRQSGGTGHLRDMLGKQDAAQTQRLEELQTAHLTAQDAQTLLLENGNRELAKKIDHLRNEVVVLRAWHKGRRWAFAGGVLSTLTGLMALAFLLAGTAPTNWLAIRLLGETTTVGAAYALAGDDRATGGLMAQTKALLDDPQFRSDYTRCMTHTQEVKRRFSCRMSMPPYAPKAS
jgi:thiamine phosphate synthase YjbQ (UPF0047 family)